MLNKLDITVHYPKNEEMKKECNKRYARAQAQVLINTFSQEIIDKIIENLEVEKIEHLNLSDKLK